MTRRNLTWRDFIGGVVGGVLGYLLGYFTHMVLFPVGVLVGVGLCFAWGHCVECWHQTCAMLDVHAEKLRTWYDERVEKTGGDLLRAIGWFCWIIASLFGLIELLPAGCKAVLGWVHGSLIHFFDLRNTWLTPLWQWVQKDSHNKIVLMRICLGFILATANFWVYMLWVAQSEPSLTTVKVDHYGNPTDPAVDVILIGALLAVFSCLLAVVSFGVVAQDSVGKERYRQQLQGRYRQWGFAGVAVSDLLAFVRVGLLLTVALVSISILLMLSIPGCFIVLPLFVLGYYILKVVRYLSETNEWLLCAVTTIVVTGCMLIWTSVLPTNPLDAIYYALLTGLTSGACSVMVRRVTQWFFARSAALRWLAEKHATQVWETATEKVIPLAWRCFVWIPYRDLLVSCMR